jgi:hypothetical protein
MTLPRHVLIACAAALLSSACYYPAPVAVVQSSPQQRYDRSWSAAVGAMMDQGLTITQEDRGAGVIRGQRGSTTVTARVSTRPDGSIEVKFDSSAAGSDTGLIYGVSEAYERRMGR